MTDKQKVDAYVNAHSNWTQELIQLRDIFNMTELKEEVKWGSPTYTLNGKLVAGMAAFKQHIAIWFHQGVFLKDTKNKLVNAKEGVTRGLRQWRFNKGDKIEPQIIKAYILESVENCKAGKEIKPVRKQGVTIPPLLKGAFDSNSKLLEAFNKLTPGKQREYAGYIGDAKRVATQQNRLVKITPMIIEGKGLYDAYKKC